LAFCRLTDQPLTFGESNDRRGRSRAFHVFYDTGLRSIHDCDTGIGGPKVNANNFGHDNFPLLGDSTEIRPLQAPFSDPNFLDRRVLRSGFWGI